MNKRNNLNPDVQIGDVVELIYMDDPYSISPMTRGVVMGFESKDLWVKRFWLVDN